MKILQNNADAISEQKILDKRNQNTESVKLLNGARQLSDLYSALLRRPGVNASDEEMSDAVTGISSLHREISSIIAESVFSSVNDYNLARVGRSVSELSAKAWVNGMSAEKASNIILELVKQVDIGEQTYEELDDEKLSYAISKGRCASKFISVVEKLDAYSPAVQQLYLGPLTPIQFITKLTNEAQQLSERIADKLFDGTTEKDKNIAKSSVLTVVSSLLGGAVSQELSSLTKALHNMSKDDQAAYLKMVKSNASSQLFIKTMEAAMPFIAASYPTVEFYEDNDFDDGDKPS